MDVLTGHIQELAPKCIPLAVDVVLLGESREELNGRLDLKESLRSVWFPPEEKKDGVYEM